MKLSNMQGLSCCVASIAFAIYSVTLFVLPVEKNIVFLLAYIFSVYALITMLASAINFFGKNVKEERFMNLPVIVLAWIFFVIQMILSFKEITDLFLPYVVALIVNLVTCAVFTMLIIAVTIATNKIEKNNDRVLKKVLFIDSLKNELSILNVNDLELKKKIKTLLDDITYSDPMSHSRLADIEESIMRKTNSMADSISNVDSAIELCDEISRLIRDRNKQCLRLKKVQDIPADSCNKAEGNKMAIIGIGVALFITLICATLLFYIVPEKQYKKAYGFMYKKQYEEAIKMFENLGKYKDSEEKIDEINQIIYEEKYNLAEKTFENGDYEEALRLYAEVISYKDARNRIIDINNRCSSDDLMYLGTYNNEPVAWKIVEFKEHDRALLLAEKSIRNLPINDDVAEISYDESYIAKWLDEEFTKQFTEKDISKIIKSDGHIAFLLNDLEVKKLKKNGVNLATDSEWWIRTESDYGFMYVSENGDISETGDINLRDKGVRPAIWISLK